MKVVVKMIVSPLERLINLVTISICHICGVEANMLCGDCKANYIADLDSRCYKCNKMTKQSQVCTACRSNSRLRRVWWMGNYHSAVKELVRSMKFGPPDQMVSPSRCNCFFPTLPDAQPIDMFFNDPPNPPITCPLKCVRAIMEL